MVRREGIEPPTCGIEAHCSNPLSYRRVLYVVINFLVRDRVVETLSEVWKTSILTVIRIPPDLTNRGDYTLFFKKIPGLEQESIKFGSA